jgi:single-stranded-DNA-specific exonuclease
MAKVQIKNLDKAAKRIIKAIKSKEKIILYGDSDLDGFSSVIILGEIIKNLEGAVSDVYFPDREKEGYGINEKALNFLKKYAPALLITIDCGIGNFKEVETAKKIGFEVIIIDHHEILDKIPKAKIVVDPKQKGDKCPFKQFAAAGLAFKLAEAALKDKLTESLRKNFIELATMATIADMMPQVDENREIIAEGLGYLESSWRPGMQVLFNLEQIKHLELIQKVYKINSLLNIRDIQNRLPVGYRILTAPNKEEAEKLSENLYEKNIERKKKINEIIETVKARISKREDEPIIFETDPSFEVALMGVAESLLVKEYDKPVFLCKKLKEDSMGGIRTPVGFNVVKAMKGYSKYLITYGGHPQAAGFRIKNTNLEKFRKHLIKYFTKNK